MGNRHGINRQTNLPGGEFYQTAVGCWITSGCLLRELIIERKRETLPGAAQEKERRHC